MAVLTRPIVVLALAACFLSSLTAGEVPEPGSEPGSSEPGILEEEVMFPEMDWTSPDWATRGPPWYENETSLDCGSAGHWCGEPE